MNTMHTVVRTAIMREQQVVAAMGGGGGRGTRKTSSCRPTTCTSGDPRTIHCPPVRMRFPIVITVPVRIRAHCGRRCRRPE